jgi:hypothetical protein
MGSKATFPQSDLLAIEFLYGENVTRPSKLSHTFNSFIYLLLGLSVVISFGFGFRGGSRDIIF